MSRGERSHTPSDYGLRGQVSDGSLREWERGLSSAVEELYGLSPLQEGLLFHTLLQDGGDSYVVQHSYQLSGVDLRACRRSWELLLERHSILRSGFFGTELEVPVQGVYAQVPLPVREEDYRGLGKEAQKEALDRYKEADRREGFDLRRAPLLRLSFLRVEESVYEVVWTQHHLLSDGWSNQVLLNEWRGYYEVLVSGGEPDTGRPDRYGDYIRYLAGRDLQEEESYWRGYLSGLTEGSLLPFIGAGVERNRGGNKYGSRLLPIAGAQAEQLFGYVREQRVTVNTLVQGVWSYLLHRYTGREEVVYGGWCRAVRRSCRRWRAEWGYTSTRCRCARGWRGSGRWAIGCGVCRRSSWGAGNTSIRRFGGCRVGARFGGTGSTACWCMRTTRCSGCRSGAAPGCG